MNSSIIKSHLRRNSVKVMLGEDEFIVPALGPREFVKILKIQKIIGPALRQAKKDDLSDDELEEVFQEALTEPAFESLMSLLEKTLEKMFPEDWENDKESVREFGTLYKDKLVPAMFQANLGSGKTKEHTKIEKIREHLNVG